MKVFKVPIVRSRSVDVNGNIHFYVSLNSETSSDTLLHVSFDSDHRMLELENNIREVFSLSQELQRIAVSLAIMF